MTTAVITTEVAAQLNNILRQYRGIEGDYCSTLIKGMWHFLCDSGIKDDSFSVADTQWIDKHAAQYADDDSSFYDLDTYYDIVCSAEHLDCNRLLAELTELADSTGIHIEDLARELKDME